MTSLVKKGFKAGKQIYNTVNEAVRQEMESVNLYNGQANHSLQHQTYRPPAQIPGQYYMPSAPPLLAPPLPPPLPPRPASIGPTSTAYATPPPFGYSYGTQNEYKPLEPSQHCASNNPPCCGNQYPVSPALSDTTSPLAEQQSGIVYTPTAAVGDCPPSCLQQHQLASHAGLPPTVSRYEPWSPSTSIHSTTQEYDSGTLPAGYGAQSTPTPTSPMQVAIPIPAVLGPSSAPTSSEADHHYGPHDLGQISPAVSFAALDDRVGGISHRHSFQHNPTPPPNAAPAELPSSPIGLVHGSASYPSDKNEFLNSGTRRDPHPFELAGRQTFLPAELPAPTAELLAPCAEIEAPQAAWHQSGPVGFVAELPAEEPNRSWANPRIAIQASLQPSASPQNSLPFELPTHETAQLFKNTFTPTLASEQSAEDATLLEAKQHQACQQPPPTPSPQLFAAYNQSNTPAPQPALQRHGASPAIPTDPHGSHPFSQPTQPQAAAGLTRLASKIQKVNLYNSQSVYAYAALPPLDTETPQGPAVGRYGVLGSEDMSGYANAASR